MAHFGRSPRRAIMWALLVLIMRSCPAILGAKAAEVACNERTAQRGSSRQEICG